METEDIEDGEILEDESNPGEQTLPETGALGEAAGRPKEELNNFERFFSKEKKNPHHHHHHESHKSSRRERPPFAGGLKKRRRSDDDIYRDKYYGKKNKREEVEEENDEDMIFMLGGSLREPERKMKNSKKAMLPSTPEDMLDPMIFNEGENEDPRPYSRRSPPRRDRLKKDRGLVRGVGSGLLKRRGGRGGPVIRKEKSRETTNDVCLFFAQGKCQRGSDCPYLHTFNQPRKLEICKFYLNDCCTKRDKCIYMHSDFPCKYFHLPNLSCSLGMKCKFSHTKLDEVQRAVLKKYADIPIKEVDEMQRFYREAGTEAFSSRNKEKKDPRIPSLFDIRVAVPPEFRDEEREGDGVTTPIPSPQSMIYENNESDEMPHKHHHKHKILAEHNEENDMTTEDHRRAVEVTTKNHHKKRSRKLEEGSDGERSRKHSEKKKKKSKKNEKDGEKEKKKKKKEHKKNKTDTVEVDSLSGNHIAHRTSECLHEDAFEVNTDEKSERESADAFAHLPKKQQELFLRIQQHQKEADTSQNSNVDDENEDDDPKTDVNWYSSDDEETPEPAQETTSPLATLLRTIQTSTSNVPAAENKADDSIIASTNLFPAPVSLPESESVPIVDASQLANIDLSSDEVTKILTSIMKTETTSSCSDTISTSLPTDSEKENDLLSSIVRKPFSTNTMERLSVIPICKPSTEDIDLRFPNFASASVTTRDSPPKDIDLRQLPFKPIPIHDAANEIDASITSHPPMEYKLKPLPTIAKVNYSTMGEVARNCSKDDPRFKRKAPEPSTETSALKPQDPRFELAMKSHTDAPLRADPRIRNDPRLAKTIPNMAAAPVVPAIKVDPRIDKEPVRANDFRDPRLLNCNKFTPEAALPYQMAAVAAAAAAAAAVALPQSVVPMLAKEQTPLRKEDPRLRFRANQNV